MRQKGFAPIIILVIVVILGVLGYFAFSKGYISVNLPKPSVNNNLVSVSSPLPSTDLGTLIWTTKKWYIPGDFEGFPIPNAMYSIEYPDTWNYSNDSDTAKRCFKIAITDPQKLLAVNIDAICTGWFGNDDLVTLPQEYSLVKKVSGTWENTPNFKYLVRVDKTNDTSTYIAGDNSSDNIKSATFYNAVLIREDINNTNTHSYFIPSNILVKYSGSSELREQYMEVADKIVSSLIIKSVNYDK